MRSRSGLWTTASTRACRFPSELPGWMGLLDSWLLKSPRTPVVEPGCASCAATGPAVVNRAATDAAVTGDTAGGALLLLLAVFLSRRFFLHPTAGNLSTRESYAPPAAAWKVNPSRS